MSKINFQTDKSVLGIILVGSQSSGKTTFFNDLSKEFSVSFVKNPSDISKDTYISSEIIVLEDIPINKREITTLKSFPYIANIRKPYSEKTFPVRRPLICETTNNIIKEEIRHFEVINFDTCDKDILRLRIRDFCLQVILDEN